MLALSYFYYAHPDLSICIIRVRSVLHQKKRQVHVAVATGLHEWAEAILFGGRARKAFLLYLSR